MSEPAINPLDYVHSTLDQEIVLKNLGFTRSESNIFTSWTKRIGKRTVVSVHINKESGTLSYHRVRLANPRKLNGSFTREDGAFDITLNDISQRLADIKESVDSPNEAEEVIHRLLDNDPDAFQPRGEIDRLMPGRCRKCGSANITEADKKGTVDCYACGGWFTLEEAEDPNQPDLPGMDKPWNLADEISDLKAYALEHGSSPRVAITYAIITPESAEDGDFAEHGWEDEEGVDLAPDEFDIENGITLVDKTVDFLRSEGAFETSSSHFSTGAWYSAQSDDYRTGNNTERGFHLIGYTPQDEHDVWKKFHKPRQHEPPGV